MRPRPTCDHRHARLTAARIGGHAPETVPWQETAAALPPAPAHDPHVPGPDPVEWNSRGAVPRTDFTAFRHDCRRLLTPEKFARVDALYNATARRVHDRPAEPTVDQVVDDLAADLDACTALDDAVTVLRATQAGLFKRGWIPGADLEKTIGRLCNPERGLALSDGEWRRLRAYASPERAAVCALNAAAVPNNDMRRLTVADAADGAWLLAALPPQAALYVRALRLLRLSWGAGPGDPLVTAGTAGISALLRDARRDLGLRLANRLVSGDERNVRFRGQLGLYLHDMRQNGDLA